MHPFIGVGVVAPQVRAQILRRAIVPDVGQNSADI